MTQTDLSRAIAATGDEWQKHGMRVVDPETGAAYRLTGIGWQDDQGEDALTYSQWLQRTGFAIAAGPDWQDDATAGVLLGLMPEVSLEIACWVDGLPRWRCTTADAIISGDSRGEAIARAYVASKGAM